MIKIINLKGGENMSVKTTKQRERILEVVKQANGHITAAQVYQKLLSDDKTIGAATVYRNLNYLYDNHLINRIQHPELGYIYDANLHDHYHFHCEVCDQFYDVDDIILKDLENEVASTFGGKVTSHMIFFKGVCPSCLKAQQKKN